MGREKWSGWAARWKAAWKASFSCFPPGLSHRELSFLEGWSPFSILVCLEGSCLLV